MKRFLREQVMKIADMLETVIGILLAFSIGILVIY